MRPTDRERLHWRTRCAAAVPTASDDFLDELTDHVLAARHAVLARGGSEADADQAAERELAGWRTITPPTRPDRRRFRLGDPLDWRGALRLLHRRPSYAVSVVLLLAIGIAASSTVAAVLYGVLGRPLSYPAADRLVTVWQRSARNGTGQLSFPDARDLARSGVFDAAAVFVGGVGTFSGGAATARVNALFTEPAMLDMLGATPIKGRLYTAADIGGDAAVISHRLWQSQFGGADDIIGRRFRLNGAALTIVGVLGPGFDFEVPVARTFLLSDHDIWRVFDGPGDFESRRDVTTYQMLARLAPGASAEAAVAALDGTAARLAQEHPASNRERTFVALPLLDIVTEAARPSLALAAVAAALLLVAALANLGGLALVRARAQQQELAIRNALGATTFHLARHVLVEQIPLVALSLGIGVVTGRAATLALAGSRSVRLPRPDAIAFDGLALLVACAVAAVGLLVLTGATLSAGLGRNAPIGASRVAGGRSRRLQQSLVVTEVALALVLCTTAALLGATLIRVVSASGGFDSRGRLTFRVSAFASDFPSREHVTAFFDQLSAALRAIPGVDHVAFSSSLPLTGHFNGSDVVGRLGDTARDRVTGGWQHVTPGYFQAAGIHFLRGRDFTEQERTMPAHVSILSETMALRVFNTTDVVGQRVQAGGGDDWHEVIGVVEDVRHRSLAEADDLRIYDLTGQHWSRTLFAVVGTRDGAETDLIDQVRTAVAAVSPAVPVFEVATGEDLRRRSTSPQRLAMWLATSVALAALLIALFGIHAIVAFSVGQRRREIGVRMALGATRWQVARLVFGEAGGVTAVGWILGLALVGIAANGLAAIIPSVEGSTWMVAAIVSALIAGAALAAAAPAAWRAATVDPVRELTS